MKQKDALEILKMGHNVFLTGSAGSGKTFLLNKYIKFLKENKVNVGITASTGIAATHMNGMTIHSWSGLGIAEALSKDEMLSILKKPQIVRRFKKARVLIIDEVSMLHSFRLDLIDELLKTFFNNNLAFGGLQVVLCGDFFQLPPINKNRKKADFINKSKIWNDMNLKVCYLNEQYRQNDDELLNILEDIRSGKTGEHTVASLRKRYKKSVGINSSTKLSTHNFNIDRINEDELRKIPETAKSYQMQFSGNKKLSESIKNNCLSPERLILKKGAVVMFTKNNIDMSYANGTLGKVIDFNENGLPIVETKDGEEILAEPEEWAVEEDGKTKAQVRQIPLRLAWAITIHKSQGMTLDSAEIDLSRSFVEGMGYVALSRLSSIEGLNLQGFNEMALKVNEEIISLDKKLKKNSESALDDLKKMSSSEKKDRLNIFINKVEKTEKEDISTLEKTKLLIEEKMSIADIAKKRGIKESTVIGYLEKIINSGEKLNLKYLEKDFEKDKLKIIKAAFKKVDDYKLAPVADLLDNKFTFDELKMVRLFIKK